MDRQNLFRICNKNAVNEDSVQTKLKFFCKQKDRNNGKNIQSFLHHLIKTAHTIYVKTLLTVEEEEHTITFQETVCKKQVSTIKHRFQFIFRLCH